MNKINPEYVDELKTIINTSQFPVHMNMTLDGIGIDEAQVSIRLDDCHLQAFGIVHGGTLATLIDTVTFWAAFMRLPEDAGLVNVDLKLNYLAQAVTGKLTAKGRCLRPGKTISYAEAGVYDEAGTLVAHGTSSLMALPGKGLKLAHTKFSSGE